MKSLKTIRKLFKLGATLSKIAFVCAVVGGCGCIAGLLSAAVGGDFAVKLQGVTIHGILGHSDGSVVAALSGWLIVCAGEAALAGFAKSCFANAQQAGTPFTFAGAREMRRLGVLTMAVPIGCALVASVAAGLVANFMNAGFPFRRRHKHRPGPHVSSGRAALPLRRGTRGDESRTKCRKLHRGRALKLLPKEILRSPRKNAKGADGQDKAQLH